MLAFLSVFFGGGCVFFFGGGEGFLGVLSCFLAFLLSFFLAFLLSCFLAFLLGAEGPRQEKLRRSQARCASKRLKTKIMKIT